MADWRDITPDFNSVINQIDNIKPLRKFCSPSHTNDLDMMQLGNGMSIEGGKNTFCYVVYDVNAFNDRLRPYKNIRQHTRNIEKRGAYRNKSG